MSLISLIVPCFNEEQNILPFYNEITNILVELKKIEKEADFELLFIDDGSKDNSYAEIQKLHQKDFRVKCISFSRNFGKEAALFSGIRSATGDCAVILDSDLQHPPSTVIDMFKKWKEGFEVVEGVKTDRGKESLLHKTFTKIFYDAISKAVGMDMKNSSDFKLLDKKVLNVLASLKERNTFFRALSFWVGFNKTTVYYEVQERNFGNSKWSTKSLIKYAIKNVLSFSYAPLQIITWAGVIFILIGLAFAVDALISFCKGLSASGFPTLIFLLLVGTGGIMISLGIIGAYIAQIYDELKARPQYIVGKKID